MKTNINILFVFLLLMTASCKDSFFDINENPNAPSQEEVEPRYMLPMVLNATAKKMAINYDFSAHWMGYWSRAAGTYGQSIPLENYNLTTSYEQNQWVAGNTSVVNPAISWYDILQDATVMEQKGREMNQPFYVGIAKVVKAIGFMYLVDMYNNVPYSEAFDPVNKIAPAYDNGQDIYNDLFLQLDTASQIFTRDDLEFTNEINQSDIMFGGNLDLWNKLVNTQRLKLLIHESEVLGSIPSSEIAKITANGHGFLMSGETAEVQPGYSVNQYQLNPYYGAYLRDHNNVIIDNFNRANNYLLNKMRDNGDMRYQYVYSKADNPVDDNEYFGYDFGVTSSDVSASESSNVAGPGLVKSPTQPQWLFTSVESMFLQAEAIQRGWISGNAEQAYRDAVTESHRWLGVADAEGVATNYLNNENVAKWSENSNKIGLIVTQKYLALPGINNFEAWVDYRRLGLPADIPLSKSPSRNNRHIPLRLLYPQNEYSYNSANVAAQGDINAQTSRIFWDPN
jgi:hypothetical protein